MNVVYVVHGREFAKMAARSLQSVRRLYRVTPTFYVDRPYGLQNEVVIPFDQPFMVTNLLAQTMFTMSSDFDDTTLFLDADVIANEKRELPEDDLSVTWRDNVGQLSDLQPYNYGVLIASPTIATKFAFQWMLNHVLHQTAEHQKWYGNQIALRELVGPPMRDSGVSWVKKEVFSLQVRHLPCREWNYTPEAEDEDVSGKAFVHVKGNRKGMFDHYFGRALGAAA